MRSEISNKKLRFALIFLLPIVLLVSFLLMTSVASAMTPEEAKIIYDDMGCYVLDKTAEGCNNYKCLEVALALMHYMPAWDDSEPIPEPTPEPIPDPDVCVPEWCSLPMQDCSLPPLTDGHDSCGNHCSKPSPEWPNCIE